MKRFQKIENYKLYFVAVKRKVKPICNTLHVKRRGSKNYDSTEASPPAALRSVLLIIRPRRVASRLMAVVDIRTLLDTCTPTGPGPSPAPLRSGGGHLATGPASAPCRPREGLKPSAHVRTPPGPRSARLDPFTASRIEAPESRSQRPRPATLDHVPTTSKRPRSRSAPAPRPAGPDDVALVDPAHGSPVDAWAHQDDPAHRSPAGPPAAPAAHEKTPGRFPPGARRSC